jgi:uncharacterized protein YdeI (BOF family)
MKKVLVLLAFTLVTSMSFAQGKDHVTMKSDGKVYWMRGGESIRIAIDVPLKNGSVVNYKGNITAKDGQVTQLQKGDKVLMDGTLVSKKSKA